MAIAFVNATDRSNSGETDGANQKTIAWGNNLVAGNAAFLGVFWKSASKHITGVVDSAGNSYPDCGIGEKSREGDGAAQLFGVPNIAAGTTPNVVIQWDGLAFAIDAYLLQYSGCHLTTLFGVTASGSATSGTVITTSSFTPGITDGMVLSFAVSNDTNGLVGLIGGTNGTSRVAPAAWGEIVQDRIYSGAMGSSITAAANFSTALTLGVHIAAVVQPAAGGGGSAAPTMQAINRRRR